MEFLTAKVAVYKNGYVVNSAEIKFTLESRLLNIIQTAQPTFTEVEFYSQIFDNAIGHTSYILSDGTAENFASVTFFFQVTE